MKTVDRSQIGKLASQETQWAYGALDACITLEIHEALWPRVEADARAHMHYDFSMTMQGPALLTQFRGVAVDAVAVGKALNLLRGEIPTLRAVIAAEVKKLGGTEFKYAKGAAPSYQQVAKFIYEEVKAKKQQNKQGKVSTDKECLKRVKKQKPVLGPFVDALQLLRDIQKQIERLETGLSPDGRMRSVSNVGGTETGRWSFNSDAYGRGTNMANNDRRVRNIYVADPGFVMINADLEQAESRIIAYCAQDEAYIAAHESGNVHALAGHTFWPNDSRLPFTGDLKLDKALMKQTPAWWIPQAPPKPGEEPAFSVYDMSKRGQHGLNYLLTPRGLAIWLGCTVKEAELYYERYFTKYPRILHFHNEIKAQLELTSEVIGPMGVRRQAFGRAWDRATLKEIVAHIPQQTCAYVVDIGMYRLYRDYEPHHIQLLGQAYDSILCQTPRAELEQSMNIVREAMRVEVPIHSRTMVIPVEVHCGPNFRDQMPYSAFVEWEVSRAAA